MLKLLISAVAGLVLFCLSACGQSAGTGGASSATVGQVAPPLMVTQSYNTAAGEAIQLADFKGKVVAVDFWATWCGPCISSMPHLTVWHRLYSERGLVIIGYTDKSSKNLDVFLEEHHIPYIIGVGPNVFDQTYGITGIPHLVLIDHEGKIIKRGHPMTFDDVDIEAALSAADL